MIKIYPRTQTSSIKSQTPLNLNVITYNIRTGIAQESNPSNNWNVRNEFLTKYLASLDGDIIGIQEAYWFQIDYITEHMTNRRYAYTGLGREDGVHGGEHSAILFDVEKFKMLDGETFWLSDNPNYVSKTWGNAYYRVCTWALFEDIVSKDQFYVFSTHFDFSDEFHSKAIALIHQKISEFTSDAPVFIVGDMNLDPSDIGYGLFVDSAQLKPLRDSHVVYYNKSLVFDFSLTHFNASYEPKFAQRIDFIFISEQVNVIFCEIPKVSYGTNQTYSDHYPVLLKCTI